jgi:hypothetical protein
MAKPAAAAAAAQLHSFPELLRGDASRFVAHLEQEIRTQGTPTKEKELQKLVVALLKRLHPQWTVLEEREVPVPTDSQPNRKGKCDVLIRHAGESCVLELKYIPAQYYNAESRKAGQRRIALNDRNQTRSLGETVVPGLERDQLGKCWVQLISHVSPAVTSVIKRGGEQKLSEEQLSNLLIYSHIHGQQCEDLLSTGREADRVSKQKNWATGETMTPFFYFTEVDCAVTSALEQAKMYQRNITPRPQAAVALVGFGHRVIIGEERAKEEKKKEERAPEKQGPLQTISDLADVLDDDFVTDDEDPDDDDFADDNEESGESEEDESE